MERGLGRRAEDNPREVALAIYLLGMPAALNGNDDQLGRPGRHQNSTKTAPRSGCHRGLTVRSLPAPGASAAAVVARLCRPGGGRAMRPSIAGSGSF